VGYAEGSGSGSGEGDSGELPGGDKINERFKSTYHYCNMEAYEYMDIRAMEKAEKMFTKAFAAARVAYAESGLGDKHPLVCFAVQHFGELYRRWGLHTRAIRCYYWAAMTLRETMGELYTPVGLCYDWYDHQVFFFRFFCPFLFLSLFFPRSFLLRSCIYFRFFFLCVCGGG